MKKKVKKNKFYPLPNASIFLRVLFSSFLIQTIILMFGYWLNSISVVIILVTIPTIMFIIGSRQLSDGAKQLIASCVVSYSTIPLIVCGYVLLKKSFIEGLRHLSTDTTFPYIAMITAAFFYSQLRSTWFGGKK